MENKIPQILFWIARIWAALMAAMVLLIFFGHLFTDGIGPVFDMTLRESLMMAAFFISWLGLVLGWRWERWGGSLIVGGMAVFYPLNYLFSGSFPRGPVFLMIASPGVLFLVSSVLKKQDT